MISNDLGNVVNLKFAKLPEDLQRICVFTIYRTLNGRMLGRA